ncbi:hypothetical protein PRIPAC_78195 [Pristionchus pacificus]|nr:hypothetical protein PRIPAC_78195 [Pristionchus pacificus]
MTAATKTAKKTTVTCLICEAKTISVHLGVNACRACSVFYRRSFGKKPYACRSNTLQCPVKKDYGITCKRCRFDRIERILAESGAKQADSDISERLPLHDPSTSSVNRGRTLSTETSDSESQVVSDRPLLAKLRAAYAAMSFTRHTSELSARANTPHPMEIRAMLGPMYPATFTSMNHGNRVLLTTILEFASASFVEFNTLSNDEQWKLAVNFFYHFRAFDSCYRAERAFPNDLNKTFGTFTTWISEDAVDGFFDNMPNAGDSHEAKRVMLAKVHTRIAPARAAMKRVAPDEHEFLAMAGIMFWTLEGLIARDEIITNGEEYRKEILRKLNAYYRDELGISDYVARVGELFTLMMHFEKVQDIQDQYEMLRLLDVVGEDNFTYSLQR